MAETFKGYVKKIDFEPKLELLEYHIYAHVFLELLDGSKKDVYTDNPRFEAAFLTAYSLANHPPNRHEYIAVDYEDVKGERKVVRVTLNPDY